MQEIQLVFERSNSTKKRKDGDLLNDSFAGIPAPMKDSKVRNRVPVDPLMLDQMTQSYQQNPLYLKNLKMWDHIIKEISKL